MISEDILESLVPDIQVLKKFPDSGQKDVFLVSHKELGQVIFKVVKADDKRVGREIQIVTENLFALGKFLRKTSLDELPQIWNIFVGQMRRGDGKGMLKKGYFSLIYA